jgi:hypothetical protein
VRKFVSLLAEGRWFLPKYIVKCIWILSSVVSPQIHCKMYLGSLLGSLIHQ